MCGSSSPISDPISIITDPISNVLGTDGSGGGLLGGLAQVDSAINNGIPGGWATVGGAALLAAGITDPTLLSMADSGTLTEASISNAGFDPNALAQQIDPYAGLSANAPVDTTLSQQAANFVGPTGTPDIAAADAAAQANKTALSQAGNILGNTTDASGNIVQTFDDGSTMTTAPDGTVVSSTDAPTTSGLSSTAQSLAKQAASKLLSSATGTSAVKAGLNALTGGTKTPTGAGTAATSTGGGASALPTMPAAPVGTLVKGSQIALPMTNFVAPAATNITPTYNPLSLQEIQNAREGGIMHKASGGNLGMNPVRMKGKETTHAKLFGMDGVPLYQVPHLQVGGSMQERTLPEGHNAQFFSEGGLGSIKHRYVKGDGDGTSDSIPAMLANGEFVIPADVVSSLGNGSNDSGAKILDSFLNTVREHKQKHDAKHLPPDSKGPLGYLLEAKQKVRK
jgi:hypothetical protein